jgi:hypothetical protein
MEERPTPAIHIDPPKRKLSGKWKVFVASVVALVALGCVVIYIYGWKLPKHASAEAYELVIRESPWAIGLLWLLEFCRENRRQWRQKLTQHLIKAMRSLWAPCAGFVLVFLAYLFILTPGQMFQEKAREEAAAMDSNTVLSNKLFKANAEISNLKQTKEKQERDETKKRLNGLSDTVTQVTKTLVDAMLATNQAPQVAALDAISKAPLLPLTNVFGGDGSFDFESSRQAYNKMRAKIDAAEALSLIKATEGDDTTLSNCVPFLNYFVQSLQTALNSVAESNGDKVLSNFKGTPRVLAGMHNFARIKMDRNSKWNFGISFFAKPGADVRMFVSLEPPAGTVDASFVYYKKSRNFTYDLSESKTLDSGSIPQNQDYRPILEHIAALMVAAAQNKYPLTGK